jgi:hypothetical protein
MFSRRRFKRSLPLEDRLASLARDVREKASLLPHGRERDDMLKKASQAETPSHLDDWVNSRDCGRRSEH